MNHPKVGVGVVVVKDGKVLVGKRIGSHGAETWAFPGGHLEWNEKIEECAKRELTEETGITIKNIKPASFTNDIFKEEGKHYLTAFVICEYDSGEVEIKEPNKCLEWRWCSWDEIPTPRFLPLHHLIESGYNPF